MLKFLFPIKVTERIYNRFIDKGEVSDTILRLLAIKVVKGEPFNSMEWAIFCGKTDEINSLILKIRKDEKDS